MNNDEYLNTLFDELSAHGVTFDPASNQSLKEILKQVSHDKYLYKKVCELKKCYQRLQQHQQQVNDSSVSIAPLTEKLNNIFSRWE